MQNAQVPAGLFAEAPARHWQPVLADLLPCPGHPPLRDQQIERLCGRFTPNAGVPTWMLKESVGFRVRIRVWGFKV